MNTLFNYWRVYCLAKEMKCALAKVTLILMISCKSFREYWLGTLFIQCLGTVHQNSAQKLDAIKANDNLDDVSHTTLKDRIRLIRVVYLLRHHLIKTRQIRASFCTFPPRHHRRRGDKKTGGFCGSQKTHLGMNAFATRSPASGTTVSAD